MGTSRTYRKAKHPLELPPGEDIVELFLQETPTQTIEERGSFLERYKYFQEI
ncbi:MAG: hypothetical protein ACFFGZ_13595 [Candidatus Thorarchaeota archaeon]